jgi:hypothetical protein
MSFLNPIVVIRRLLRKREESDVWLGLHPPKKMQQVLDRERTRADRTGACVVAITFQPRVPEQSSACLVFLVKTLKERLRTTDEAGWLGEQQICVLLPCTGPLGAWKLAADICSRFPDSIAPPVCTIDAYPSATPEHPQPAQADAAPR